MLLKNYIQILKRKNKNISFCKEIHMFIFKTKIEKPKLHWS